MNQFSTRLALVGTLLACSVFALASLNGCDSYDAPPEVKMVQRPDGTWTKETLVELQFSEAIEPNSLEFSIWAGTDFDIEGDIAADAQPLVDKCSLETGACGGMTYALNEAGDLLAITVGDQFDDREGEPNIFIVNPGVADMAGRTREVETRMAFQISPVVVGGPVDIQMESGIVSMTADLGNVVPGVFLRMYMDFAIDADTGEFQMTATFAELAETLADGSTPPKNYAQLDGYVFPQGAAAWAVFIRGIIQPKSPGEYFFKSDPTDVEISVLSGAIPVRLQGLILQGTIEPGAGDNGEDVATGTLSTTSGAFQVGNDWRELDAITTNWLGWGFATSEIPTDLPRTCEDAPCSRMVDDGGACVLPAEWDVTDVCK